MTNLLLTPIMSTVRHWYIVTCSGRKICLKIPREKRIRSKTGSDHREIITNASALRHWKLILWGLQKTFSSHTYEDAHPHWNASSFSPPLTRGGWLPFESPLAPRGDYMSLSGAVTGAGEGCVSKRKKEENGDGDRGDTRAVFKKL